MTDRAPTHADSLPGLLAEAAALIPADPAAAVARLEAALAAAPADPAPRLMLGAALRAKGDAAGAVAVLEALAADEPGAAAVWLELGLARLALGRSRPATAALMRAVALDGGLTLAWGLLFDLLTLAGETAAARDARARQMRSAAAEPALKAAADALCERRLPEAERRLGAILAQRPGDVGVLFMLGEVQARLGRDAQARASLARCLEIAPAFHEARHAHAVMLLRRGLAAEALAQARRLMDAAPSRLGHRLLMWSACDLAGDYDGALACSLDLTNDYPDQPQAFVYLGNALRTVGRADEAVDAYRRAIALRPDFGEAYWSLANLKTWRFPDQDVAAMRRELARADLREADRRHLFFALGKALEDDGAAAPAFEAYAAGAALARARLGYQAEATTNLARRCATVFTPAFVADRADAGAAAADPIFIVGMPRAGSTLVEQILASHSRVEGAAELADMPAIAWSETPPPYPEGLDGLDGAALTALGEAYLARTRVRRRLGRAYFVDKTPENFLHVGLISLILPGARIIDVRRHPLACGLSVFKQLFAHGGAFTYDLADIGRYYRDYVALMAHYDRVLPGRVCRVIYEDLVADPEAQVRRLLAWCGLPFEAACLDFHRSERAVRTPSSEQVRRPIFTDALDAWRPFEPWLGPLKDALGPVLDAYPGIPQLPPGG